MTSVTVSKGVTSNYNYVTNISSGGATAISAVTVLSGGILEQTEVLSGGKVVFSAGAVGSNVNLGSGGTLTIAGLDNGVDAAGGTINILSGGELENYGANAGTVVTVSSGGLALDGAFASGSTINVSSGAVISAFTNSGGTFDILTPVYLLSGSVSSAVAASTLRTLNANASGVTVSKGFDLTVNSGGTATSVTILSGGSAAVASGGSTANTVVNGGGVENLAGGSAVSTTVSSGGALNVTSGGYTAGAYVSSGGNENITGTGASGTAIGSGSVVGPGGTETLKAGGVEIGGTVSSGGSQVIGSGGAATGETVYGSQTVSSGGSASTTTIGSGGVQTVAAGGNDSGVTLNGGGLLTVGSGGTASNVTVNSGATLIISSGGSVSGFTNNGGTIRGTPVYIQSGSVISSLGTSETGYTPPKTFDLHVTSGGLVTSSVISAGSNEFITGNGSSGSAIGSASRVLAGATETLTSGGVEIGGVDSGTLTVGSGSTVTNETVGAGGTLVLSSGASAAGAISFAGSGGKLVVDGAAPAATISGFGPGDDIVLSALPFTSGATVSASGNTITITDGGSTYTLNVAGAGTSGDHYTLVNDGGVEELMPCFVAGTRILTVAGEVRVEDIAVGDDVVVVREGGPATRRVVWTGRRSLDISRHPEPALVRPVRIVADAFGAGLPERDLRLSPMHAVYVDGNLFEAQSLVNGTSIHVEANTRQVTYHHIELDAHDVVLAEGLPAESFLNVGNRNMFEGQAEPMLLHPDFAAPADGGFCAPVVREGAALNELRARLNERAAGQAKRKKSLF